MRNRLKEQVERLAGDSDMSPAPDGRLAVAPSLE
jgi:hypothetical protein